MNLSIGTEHAKAYQKAGGKNEDIVTIAKEKWYHTDFDSDSLSVEDLTILIDVTDSQFDLRDTPSKRAVLRKMRSVVKLRQGGKVVRSLELMADALKMHIKKLPRHWVFREELGQVDAWFVDLIQFHPARNDRDGYRPAYVAIALTAKCRGKRVKKSITFQRETLAGGRTAGGMLEFLGLMEESEELVERYHEELATYKQYTLMNGEQFLVTGKGETGFDDSGDEDKEKSWWRTEKHIMLSRNGEATRAVMDDWIEFGEEGKDQILYADVGYWRSIGSGKASTKEEDDDFEVDGAVTEEAPQLPVQPYLCVFALHFHEFVVTHVSNLTVYEYDAALTDKLVLPKRHRELIDVLVSTTDRAAEDIVRGKRGGLVILCSGAPGTGKTLTAEVYSEVAKRPLYMVQCSQLGIDAKELESQLSTALQRSVRWRAILLIDEADVYIHERGDDVNQNAIVGVFLRLLEYYSGILFLTTNRATVVDDAIHSRCLAHVRYKIPDVSDRTKIWKILSRQYRVALDDDLIRELVQEFPISGRGIKQLCRLAQTMRTKVNLELFKWLSEFQDNDTK